MSSAPAVESGIESLGFLEAAEVFAAHDVDALRTEMSRTENGGAENLLKRSPLVAALADGAQLRSFVDAILGPAARPFSAFFLDKTAGQNWQMPWHQNLRLPVAESTNAPAELIDYGVPHIIPDAAYLNGVLIVRVSLDAQSPENGALEVIPGSHNRGILAEDAIAEAVRAQPVYSPRLLAGSVFLFKALLVHRSEPSRLESRRRILQIEYSANPAPAGFSWYGL